MKTSLKVGLYMAAAAFVACGKTSPEATTQPQQQTANTTELSSLDDQLPEAAVMRVKLDASGNVVKESAAMRMVAATGDDALENEFANGSAQASGKRIDELDATTSTQSWSLTQYGLGDDDQLPQPQQQQPQQNGPIGNEQYPGQQQPTYPGQQQPNYPSQDQQNCQPCQAQQSNCNPCDNQVEHRQGPSTSVYPVSRKTIIEHRTKHVYPRQYVDVYPVEHVVVHPTQTVTNVHPLTQQIQYVGNHCQQQSACGYGAQYYPTVSYNSYSQYYHYQSYRDHGGYRYFRYCRPRIFSRHGW